jgi:flagellar protein FlbD
MIHLTRRSGQDLVLNADLIESIEASPETLVALVTGRKMLVQESLEEVVRRVLEYRRRMRAYPVPVAGIPESGAAGEAEQ